MTTVAGSRTHVPATLERLLMEQCLRGDEQAWAALHERYFPVTVAFLRRMGVRDADVEDAAQEVFLQVFRYLSRFRGQAEFRTWLYQLCITQTRRTRRVYFVRSVLQRLLMQAPEALVSGPGFSEEAAQRRLDAALEKLTDAQRVVFVLYEMQGLPGKEVATIVGTTEASVWRRLHHARRAVQASLGLSGEEKAS